MNDEYNSSFTGEQIDEAVSDVRTNKEKWDDVASKENKATYNTTTILAASWADGTYAFESEFPSDTYDIEISLSENTTTEQAEAFSGALIVGSSTTNVIKALGDVPTIDIEIIVKAVAK